MYIGVVQVWPTPVTAKMAPRPILWQMHVYSTKRKVCPLPVRLYRVRDIYKSRPFYSNQFYKLYSHNVYYHAIYCMSKSRRQTFILEENSQRWGSNLGSRRRTVVPYLWPYVFDSYSKSLTIYSKFYSNQ